MAGTSRWDRKTHSLYYCLFDAMPKCRTSTGVLDVEKIAGAIGYTREGLYKQLRTNRVTLRRAKDLLDFAKKQGDPGALTIEKLAQFMLV